MNLKTEYLKLIDIVKARLEKEGRPARNEDIGSELGFKSRTSFQNLLGENGKVTEKHIRELKLHYPFLSENVTPKAMEYGGLQGVDPMIIIDRLSDSLRELTESNKTLARSNEKLVNMFHANSGGTG